jgi:5-methylcytosine-specific restriction endonuclease McrA
VYCGCENRKTLTLDHVIPQSKGGPNKWGNLVTACKKCNNEKADLTLKEYGKPIPKPQRPHYLMLLKKTTFIPDEWKPYLGM